MASSLAGRVAAETLVRLEDPGRPAGQLVEELVLLLRRPGVSLEPHHHGVFETAIPQALAELIDQRFPQRPARLRIDVRRQRDVLRLAGAAVQHGHQRPVAQGHAELREVVLHLFQPASRHGFGVALFLHHVDFPQHQHDHLRPAHVLFGHVEVAIHDREVVVVAVLAGLHPADHRLLVAEVGVADQRDVDRCGSRSRRSA